METSCTFTFEGDHGGTYYVPCDQVKYIDSGNLVSYSSENFYAYPDIRDSSSNYDYIVFNADSYPYWRSGYNSYQYITNANNIKFNNTSYFYRDFDLVILFCLFIISLTRIINVFGRR